MRARVAAQVGQAEFGAAGEHAVRVVAARHDLRVHEIVAGDPAGASGHAAAGRTGMVATVPRAAASWARACSRAPAVVAVLMEFPSVSVER